MCNSRAIVVTTTKCELDVWLDSEKPHGKFQIPIWDGVETSFRTEGRTSLRSHSGHNNERQTRYGPQEKRHEKFQVPIWDSVEKKPRNLKLNLERTDTRTN
jgi:hypothetical protein